MDARSGPALCALLLGYAWSGGSCEAVLCTCTGADCGSLYSTESACVEDHESCTTTCSGDADCDDEEWCNPCAHGSCPVCTDCVQDCAPHPCATGRDVACRQLRPDCGETGVAVVGESLCWECVDLVSCEPLPDDCRVRGCEVGRTCEACPSAGGTAFVCVPAGAAC